MKKKIDYIIHRLNLNGACIFIIFMEDWKLMLADNTGHFIVLCVCFVDRCLSFCTFLFGHCVVCSLICGFWLPLCIFKLFLAMEIWIKRFLFNNNKLFWTQTVHTPGKQCRLRWTTWKESGLQCLLNGPLIRNLLSWANQKSRISFFFQKAWTKSMQPLYILLHLSCFEIWWFNYTMLKDRL